MIDETNAPSDITPADPTVSVPTVPSPDVTPIAPVSENINDIDYGRAIKDYGQQSTPQEITPQEEK
jgi:hypothetical protein